MPDVSPGQFFRFAAEHAELLQDLYRADGLTEVEIHGLIRKHAVEGSPSTTHVFTRLQELGILEPAPEATARYELSRPFAGLMRFLLRQYRLTSVKVIQSYFSALEEQAGQLDSAQRNNNPDMWMRVALELADHIEEMRHDSRNNRNGVIGTIMRIKTARERITPAARYQEVNRLWQTYIIPLRDMIDSRKMLDVTLQHVRRVPADAPATVGAGRAEVRSRAEDILARMVRLRRDVLNDFEESLREITPLYEELRRENALARGASAAIEQMMRTGVRAAGLARRLAISSWQMQGQFSDAALEAHIAGVAAYTPRPPEPVRVEADAGADVHPLDLAAFDAAVADALPIADGFAWLTEHYPDEPSAQVLRLYGRLHSERYGATVFAETPTRYPLGRRTARAYPMRIEKPEGRRAHARSART